MPQNKYFFQIAIEIQFACANGLGISDQKIAEEIWSAHV